MTWEEFRPYFKSLCHRFPKLSTEAEPTKLFNLKLVINSIDHRRFWRGSERLGTPPYRGCGLRTRGVAVVRLGGEFDKSGEQDLRRLPGSGTFGDRGAGGYCRRCCAKFLLFGPSAVFRVQLGRALFRRNTRL